MDATHLESLVRIEEELRGHMEREEVALLRIEKLLDGNGQPGLVRTQVSLDERLKSMEAWKTWVISAVLAMGLAAAAMIVQIALVWVRKGP